MEKEKINYNAFLDSQSDDDNLSLKSGLKDGAFKNKGRFSNNENKIPSKSQFDEAVSDIRKNDNSIISEIRDLSIKYKQYITDRTLNVNKNPISKELEKETIKKLCEIGLVLNEDETQKFGTGSVGLINLLLNSVLIQRDKINEMSYEIHSLKNILNTIIKALNEEEK
jgi:hypothetical protein